MAHMFGEAFRWKAVRLQIGYPAKRPIVDQNVVAFLLIDAAGQ